MGNLLFSPSGRISPAQFMSGITVVIIAGLVLQLIPVFIPALSLLGIIGLALLWATVVLWIKRYHDAGKTGWMCLIPIIVGGVIGAIAGMILAPMFVDPGAAAALAEATENADFGAIMSAAGSGGMTKVGGIVVALVGAAISYAVAIVFNNMIKSEPNDNRFGPAT